MTVTESLSYSWQHILAIFYISYTPTADDRLSQGVRIFGVIRIVPFTIIVFDLCLSPLGYKIK